MTDYGKGSVLGTATTLPATSALSLFLVDKIHPVILIGFLVVSIFSLIVSVSLIARYLINSRH